MRMDEANKEHNVTFTSRLHTNTVTANQHIFLQCSKCGANLER